MTRRYIHFSTRDLEEAILQLHGLLQEGGKQDVILKVTECPRCKARNRPDAARCSFCGLILDKKLTEEIDEEIALKDMLPQYKSSR